MRKVIATTLFALSLVTVTWAGAIAGPSGGGDGPQAQASAPARPAPISPADRAAKEAVPSFSWRAARRAVAYEFQLAADPAFESIVIGRGAGRGSFKTRNTYATVDQVLPDGTYYWRVRGIDRRDRAGRWSRTRSFVKRWTTRAELAGPDADEPVIHPTRPLVLRWSRVHHAHRYLVTIATDPSLASPVTPRGAPVDTAANVLSLPYPLSPGRYYWAVTPVDTRGHQGARSEVGSFSWTWPTRYSELGLPQPRVEDLRPDEPQVFDPQFSWDPIPGAVEYELEVNSSEDFAVGSKVCCDGPTTATAHAPTKVFANNRYYWRMRARDADGNAGEWNFGPSFDKDFDPPISDPNHPEGRSTIRSLHLRDNDSDPANDLDPSTPSLPDVNYPVVVWDPVPGASSYEVEVAPDCNWTSLDTFDVRTATTAWTPLSPVWNGISPLGGAFNRVVSTDRWALDDNVAYCVRVRARADRDAKNEEILSDWTQLNGVGQPAFRYRDASPLDPPADPSPQPLQAGDYLEPQTGTVTPRMPWFSWKPIQYADSYYVVVARDALFTEIADVALTQHPTYAPRFRENPWTYSDETTSYYWAVLPAARDNGNGVNTAPSQNAPRAFQKQSAPPQLLGPPNGADGLYTQPTFRWTPAEGAREYRLQVSQDPSFGSPIEDIRTNSIAYTSSSAYPADTLLYWRVRANDENKVGLTWSATGTFRQRLNTPALDAGNPTGGETIPALAFSPVQGAVSYDVQVDHIDGTDVNLTVRAPVFTPVTWYGNGVWRFQVRANFKAGPRQQPGPWSQPFGFARRLGTPAGTHAIRRRNRVLIEWEPVVGAKQYKVEIGTSDSFNFVVETARTDNTSFAPVMLHPAFHDGTPLYWRVTPVDEGRNEGGAASGELRRGKPLRLRARGRLRRGRTSVVTLRVTDSRRRGVAGATVEARGAVNARPKRTNHRGTVRLRLRPTTRGRVTFRAVKRGYRPDEVSVRVR